MRWNYLSINDHHYSIYGLPLANLHSFQKDKIILLKPKYSGITHYMKLSRVIWAPWVDRFLNNEIYCYPLSEKRCRPPVAIPSDGLAGGDRNLRLAATWWGQYHGLWCPGSLCHQDISSHGIDYVRQICACLPRGKILLHALSQCSEMIEM